MMETRGWSDLSRSYEPRKQPPEARSEGNKETDSPLRDCRRELPHQYFDFSSVRLVSDFWTPKL